MKQKKKAKTRAFVALPPKELSIEYADVASSVQGDPRLEPLHDNVPHQVSHQKSFRSDTLILFFQITAQEALIKRAELLERLAAEYSD